MIVAGIGPSAGNVDDELFAVIVGRFLTRLERTRSADVAPSQVST